MRSTQLFLLPVKTRVTLWSVVRESVPSPARSALQTDENITVLYRQMENRFPFSPTLFRDVGALKAVGPSSVNPVLAPLAPAAVAAAGTKASPERSVCPPEQRQRREGAFSLTRKSPPGPWQAVIVSIAVLEQERGICSLPHMPFASSSSLKINC